MYDQIVKTLNTLKSKEKSTILQRFFKTGKGEYGEGDIFIGLTVSEQRRIAKQFQLAALSDLKKLLQSKIHEYRVTALEILVMKYEKAKTESEKEKIVNFYLKNLRGVNNWDLVDLSAPYILGDWLIDRKNRDVLYKFAASKNLWERRIAIVSTYTLIRVGQFSDTIKICEILMKDGQDLIHKACGWMLREVGKKSEKTLIKFLNKNVKRMPRTMLRYSIERLPEEFRLYYLRMK